MRFLSALSKRFSQAKPELGKGFRPRGQSATSPLLLSLLGLLALGAGVMKFLNARTDYLVPLQESEREVERLRSLDEGAVNRAYAHVKKEYESVAAQFSEKLSPLSEPNQILLRLEDLAQKHGVESYTVEGVSPTPQEELGTVLPVGEEFLSLVGGYTVSMSGRGSFSGVYGLLWELSQMGFLPREVTISPEEERLSFTMRHVVVYGRK